MARTISCTLVETDACPEDLLRGDTPWGLQELEIVDFLGEGRLSSVVRCKCKRTGHPLALKVYHKQNMTMQNCKQVAREIEIHCRQEHPNILGLYAAFEDPEGIYLVQELASKGDLYRALGKAGGYLLEDEVAQRVMRPLISALTSLHSQGIVHRDIKPENVLTASDDTVRLADFGLALDTTQETPRACVGTLDYMAPEVVRLSHSATRSSEECGSYGIAVDVWAAGILAYELMLGGPPFEADTKEETYQRILTAEPHLPSHWDEPARDFVRQALIKDACHRPSAEALLLHPWLVAHIGEPAIPQPATPPRQV